MNVDQKLATGKEKKAAGDECFRSGDYKGDPNDAGIKKDLEDIKIKQAAVEKKGMAKFKGMYNRPAKEDKSEATEEKVEEIKSPGVAATS
ncbi:hypothetical protein FRC11_007489 [Ceratobasidium sp. 423]|nr:hypothetical protein FRC11_007489 [Ceratobasidium sp. 423]